MKFVRIFSDTYNNSIKFSEYDGLHPLFTEVFSSFGGDVADQWGRENLTFENEILLRLVEAIRNNITQLLSQYVPAQHPTHILVFEDQTLKLNVRKDLDRLLAHLLLIIDMGRHCLENHEKLKIEVVNE